MFPSKIWHHGYFNGESNKHFITAQLFAKPTISEDTERFSCSFNVGQQEIITGQLGTTLGEYAIVKDLSDDLLENWDTTYSAIDYPPLKMFGEMPIDHESNQQIPFEKLDERPLIKALVVLFEEIFPYLSIDRISLLYKRRKGDGFQKWHQDYKLGAGQITKTIVITLVSIPNTTPQLARQLTTETDKCDYAKYYCLLKTRPPERCTFGLCHRTVHHRCQMSWERYANLDVEDKYEDIFCSEHHPVQTWFDSNSISFLRYCNISKKKKLGF